MFNNVGYKIKVAAGFVAAIACIIGIVSVAIGIIFFLDGKSNYFDWFYFAVGIIICFSIYFISLLIFGFGHIIEIVEEQNMILKSIISEDINDFLSDNILTD